MLREDSYTDDLMKVMMNGVIKHSGRLIYYDNGKYWVSRFGGKKVQFNSLEKAKLYVDSGLEYWRKRIAREQRLREADENNNED